MIDRTTLPLRRAACLAAFLTLPAVAQATPATAKEDASKSAAMASLDARYVIGPAAADDFGYRIVWQSEPLVTKDARMQVVNASADSVWFGDSAGSVVRIRRDNGETVWRSSTYQGIERMMAVEYLPAERHDNVYVVTELGSIALDAVTGNLIRRSRFAQLPAAVPAVYGSSMIFGTGTGLASWFQYGSGYNWRSTTLGGHVTAPVCIAGDIAVAASTNGTVLAMDASSAGIRWTRKLSAGVEAKPAADATACYVVGLDQSVWAFELARGRVLWQHFTQAPLTNPPTRIADGLYVQIPGEGLVSFNPLPQEKPDGEIRWKSKAPGNVIGRIATNVMAWDAPTHTLSAVDVGNGRVVHQVQLPKVEQILLSPAIDGEVFVASQEGNVERLEPLARRSAPAAMTSAGQQPTATKPAPPKARAEPAAGAAAGDGAANKSSRGNG
jgi:outer membrane protein assembly factor BamB